MLIDDIEDPYCYIMELDISKKEKEYLLSVINDKQTFLI
jgi:hypothetical protein